MKTFTIDEIREYLVGKRLMRYNGREWIGVSKSNNSLNNAVSELEDIEDGIEAVTERIKSQKVKK